MIQILLLFTFIHQQEQPEWLNCQCKYINQSIAIETPGKKDLALDKQAEACAWQVAQREMAKSFPQWQHEIFKTPYGQTRLKRNTWKGKKEASGQDVYGEVNIKKKIPILVAITGRFAEDMDSAIHEIKHFIIHKLPLGGLTKMILHMHVDMVASEWAAECR